jgi:hypothetical protein
MGLEKKIKPDIFFICILAYIPILLYYVSIFIKSVNIPQWDDYIAILGFANNFLSNSHNKFALLFSQHNEHRILFCRVSTLLLYFLSGKIDFKILTLIGNLSILAFTAVLLSSTVFATHKMKPLYFVPVVFILFQPQYYENSLLTMASLSGLPVIFFAFLTLYCLGAGSIKNFIFSLVAAILTTFTNGNGMFVFLSGLIILYFYKRYKEGAVWILVGLMTVCAYFIGYTRPPLHPSPMGIVNYPTEAIKYFFYFIGSSIPYFVSEKFVQNPLLLLSGGILIFLYFIFLSYKIRSGKVNIITFAFFAYLFITAFVVTLGRSYFGAHQALSSRYMIYSDLFIIFVYITFIEFSSDKTIRLIFPFLLILSIYFNYASYKNNFQYMIIQKEELTDGLADWRMNNNTGLAYLNQPWANAVLQKAIKNGLYEPPTDTNN